MVGKPETLEVVVGWQTPMLEDDPGRQTRALKDKTAGLPRFCRTSMTQTSTYCLSQTKPKPQMKICKPATPKEAPDPKDGRG